MLGPSTARTLGEPIAVSWDDLVPPGHVSRHLERTLDRAFGRDVVEGTYAGSGRPALAPVVFFELRLIRCFAGLRWYPGSGLAAALPDPSSPGRTRDRYGVAVFRAFFERIVEPCVAAGLVWGGELCVDTTKVLANAALASVGPRFAVEAHLAARCGESAGEASGDGAGNGGEQDQVAAAARTPVPLPVAPTEADRAAQAGRAAARHDRIGAAGRPARDRPRGAHRRTADFRASATDPDAARMPTGAGRTHPGSPAHYVVDGGTARSVPAALVTPAEVQ